MRNVFFAKTYLGVMLGTWAGLAIAFTPSAQPLQELAGAPATQSAPAALTGEAHFANPQKVGFPPLIQLSAGDVANARASRNAAPKRAAASPQQKRIGASMKIGDGIEIARSDIDLARLHWTPLPDGRLAGQFEIAAADAAGLRAALRFDAGHAAPMDLREILDGAVLHMAGDDGRVFEIHGADLPQGGIYWTPALQGHALRIELILPRGVRPDALKLSVPRLSYLTESPTRAGYAENLGQSEKCQSNAACFAGTPGELQAFRQAAAAVAMMIITLPDGDTASCTGTLLNNEHVPKRPLFWSAAHCIDNQEVADTMQTVWFYQTTECTRNSQAIDPAVTVLVGGAHVLHRDARRDTLLLELNSAPPAAAFHAGWSAESLAKGQGALGIHHPSGDAKKVSTGLVRSTGGFFDGMFNQTHVLWSQGVMEVGSSGSGMFTKAADGSYRLRGGLYGGYSRCTSPGEVIAQEDRSDYYSNFGGVYAHIAEYFVPASQSSQRFAVSPPHAEEAPRAVD
jgi:hypothetical protein